MDLTVVIPALNEESTLPRQLESLLGQSWDGEWENLVVDNGSTDSTSAVVAALRKDNSRLRLVSEPNRGICHARNAGIAAAHGRSIAICDADDVAGSGWVAAMGRALVDHQLVTGSEELTMLNLSWLANSRGYSTTNTMPTFHEIFPFPYCNNAGLRKSLIDKIGGYDQTFIGAKDIEFGLRAWLAGIDVHYEPAAFVHYAYRSEARELWRQGLGYGRARPAIVRSLLARGQSRPPRFAGWKSWAWLVVNSPRAVTTEGRAVHAWVAGNRIGHLIGSVRHRTILI